MDHQRGTSHGKLTAVRYLPPVAIEGHRSSGSGTPDHPMRIATRQIAGLDPGGWTDDLRHSVQGYFDEMAGEWHTRTSPERTAVVADALARGLDGVTLPSGPAVEVGSGIGTYSALLAERFARVLSVDLSLSMLARAPAKPAFRIQADAATLPVRDAEAAGVVLINAFLFPSEVDRVLSPQGILVWVNSSAEETPIHLSVEDLVAALPGDWTGRWSRAGDGLWCVLQRSK